MNSQNIIWLIVVLVVLVGGYILFSGASSTEEEVAMDTQEVTTLGGEDTTEENEVDTMMDDKVEEEEMMDEDMESSDNTAPTMVKGTYEAYSPEKLSKAETGDVVIFFKASWCPSCRALDSDIQKNIDAIPEGVTILEVNYDSATDLKKKYGVTVQHTLVQVDANGDLVNKWVNSPTLEKVLSEIK